MDLQNTSGEQKSSMGIAAWVAAATVVALIVISIVLVERHQQAAIPVVPPNTILPLDAYAGESRHHRH